MRMGLRRIIRLHVLRIIRFVVCGIEFRWCWLMDLWWVRLILRRRIVWCLVWLVEAVVVLLCCHIDDLSKLSFDREGSSLPCDSI
jgi:hypothetical protein